jgi:hypothetical protein
MLSSSRYRLLQQRGAMQLTGCSVSWVRCDGSEQLSDRQILSSSCCGPIDHCIYRVDGCSQLLLQRGAVQ